MKYNNNNNKNINKNSNNNNNANNITSSNCGMNEIDTEAPVIWPSWCYAGDTPSDDTSALVKNLATTTSFHHQSNLSQHFKSSSATLAVSLDAITAATNSTTQKLKGKRKSTAITTNSSSISSNNITNPIDKMLSDRLNLAESKKFCDNNSSVQSSGVGNNNNNNNSNNNNNNNNTGSNSLSLFYDSKFKNVVGGETINLATTANAMDFFKTSNGDVVLSTPINNNNALTNNNTSIKSERLSPLLQQQQSQSLSSSSVQQSHSQNMTHHNGGGNGDAQSSNSRSRSATPSSFPETPPQHHPNDLLSSNFAASLASSLTSGQIKGDYPPARTYSDQLRNFAAKYNSLNESNNARNPLYEPRFNISPIKTVSSKEPSSPPENLKRLTTATSIPSPVANTNNLISTLFSSFPAAGFPSLIDMRGSQLLLSLAQAAKENEIKQHILNGPPMKRLNKRHTPPINSNPLRSQQSPTSNPTTSPQNRIPLPPNVPAALQFLSLQQKASTPMNPSLNAATPSTSQQHQHQSTANIASNINRNRTSSPLDLSATTPIGSKRLKIESPSPNRSTGSPSAAMSQQLQQSSNKNRAQTPSNGGGGSMLSSAIATASATNQRRCHAQSDEINSWSVNQVCNFVGSIDICAEYVENFREQCIDGSGLPLLTEDHLMHSLNMKLGPALKLRSVLLKKLGGPCPCVSCTSVAAITPNSSSTITQCAPSPAGSSHRPSSTDSIT